MPEMNMCAQFPENGEMCHFDEGVAGATPLGSSLGGRSPYSSSMGGGGLMGFPPLATSPLDSALDMMVKRSGPGDRAGRGDGAGHGGANGAGPSQTEDSREISDDSMGDAYTNGTATAHGAASGTAGVLPPREGRGARRAAANKASATHGVAEEEGEGEGEEGRAMAMDVEDELAEMADALLLLHESAC